MLDYIVVFQRYSFSNKPKVLFWIHLSTEPCVPIGFWLMHMVLSNLGQQCSFWKVMASSLLSCHRHHCCSVFAWWWTEWTLALLNARVVCRSLDFSLWLPVILLAVPLVCLGVIVAGRPLHDWVTVVLNFLHHLPHSGMVEVKQFRNVFLIFSQMVSIDNYFSEVLRTGYVG